VILAIWKHIETQDWTHRKTPQPLPSDRDGSGRPAKEKQQS